MKKWDSAFLPGSRRDDFALVMYRRIFWPAVISSIGQALADMADALLVGQRMGEVGLAAIGMSLPLFMLLNIFMHGFGIGGSVKYARLLGEGKPAEAIESFHHVIFSALCTAVGIALVVNLFPTVSLRLLGTTAADGDLYEQALVYVRLIAAAAPLFFLQYILSYYLRCDGRAVHASVGFVAGCTTDIVCNVLFVLVLGLETLGAGLATVSGALVCVAIYLPVLRAPKADAKAQGTLHWQGGIRPDGREAWECFKAGFSTSAQYAYQMIFLLIANHTLMQLFGSTGVAVFDMVQNASYLILYLYDAAVKAQQPLASTFYGEKDRDSLHRTLRLSFEYGLACGALAAGLIALFPQAVCAAFGMDNAAALQAGTPALRLYCLSSLFSGVSILLESYCQAVEQEKHAFIISTLRGSAVLLPVTLLLALLAPAAFWWLYPITEGLSLLLFLLWMRRGGLPTVQCDPSRVFSCRIHSRTEDLSPLTEQIDDFCAAHNASPRQSYFVSMTVEELGLATIQKAFQNADGTICVTLIACENGDFELHLRDNADLFDPFSLQTEKAGHNNVFDMDAMGVLVIKKQAKSFFYRQYQGFNTLTVKI